MDAIFHFGSLEVLAKFNETDTARVILGALPVTSVVNLWGDEIYFEIPVKLPAEDATTDLKVGDIAYWPQGACLCLFFGKTPASTNKEPKPASPVNVIGTFMASLADLRKVASGTKVSVVKR